MCKVHNVFRGMALLCVHTNIFSVEALLVRKSKKNILFGYVNNSAFVGEQIKTISKNLPSI